MADKSGEENLNIPTNNQSENRSDEIIPTTDTDSITQNQEIENMEVHHHPHVEKKNFKEYFLEFLMIFLAVTLGFFAENIREHFVNSEKEKNYMEGMLQDLEKDTAAISYDIGFKNLIVKKMDSALNIPIVNLRSIPTQDTFFHHFFFYYSWPSGFNRHDITIAQLKNTGGFSVIRKQTVLKAINELNSFYESPLEFNQNIYNEHWNKLDQFAMQLIKLPSPPPDIDDPLYYSYPHNAEVFTQYDTPMIEQLYSFTQFEKSDIIIIIENEKHYREEAAKLIELIKKEYNLANE
jgi:hypothetical protein